MTSTKEWQLSMELVTNEWQDIALTWKKEEGLMLYVNGAFRDSLKDGTVTSLIPNKQARLTIGRKSGNPPFKYTRYEARGSYRFFHQGILKTPQINVTNSVREFCCLQ